MPVHLPQTDRELERSGGSLFVVETLRPQGYVLVPTDAYLQAKPLFEAIIGHARVSFIVRTRPAWSGRVERRQAMCAD